MPVAGALLVVVGEREDVPVGVTAADRLRVGVRDGVAVGVRDDVAGGDRVGLGV